jgi:MFS family permease
MAQTPQRPPGLPVDTHGPATGGRETGTYLAVLRIPGALRFSSAGFLARMPMSMFSLGIVLLVAALTGRYALAGLVAAASSVSYAIASPQVARLADRFGQGRVLRPLALVFGTTTAVFLVTAQAGAPLPVLIVAAALAGATMPSIGAMVRARWSALLAGSSRLHTAFSLESVADELIFVIGPAVVTVLATDVFPAAGVGVAAIACVTGTLLFAAQRRTEPPRRGLAGAEPALSGPAPRIAAPGLITLVPVYLFLGAMFATVDIATVAFSSEHHRLALAGLVLGSYALGSAVGGLWYGSRHWHSALERRFAITLAIAVAGVSMLWFQPGMAALFGVIFVAGLTISPTLIAGFGLIERQAPGHRRTEGLAWLSSSISVGVSFGSPIAGRIIDSAGARGGYLFAAGCGVAAVLACLSGRRRLRAVG